MNMLSQSVRYDGLILRFAEVQREVDDANMRRYHQIGQLFDEFCSGIERQVYGDCTVQKLADDLQRNGILADIANPIRYLYWARSVYTFDPTYDTLAELSARGFSVTHAKLVFSLEDDVRDRIVQALLQADRVPSTRELESQLRLEAASAAAKAVEELSKEPAPGLQEDSGPSPAEPVPTEAPAAARAPEAARQGKPSAGAKPGADSRPAKSPAVDADVHPLKAIKALEKLVSKVLVAIPDGFIAIQTAEKRGFDSDRAQKNYKTELANLAAAVDSVGKPLAELKALLDDVKRD